MTKVRTRFAPSPTGYMHIGNLRTALYEYLIAKHEGGDFILRIEDTDQEREVEGAVDIIYDVLRLTGLNYDEGPDKPGDCGPYVQSERLPMYKKYADELVDLGGAHYCFCSEEDIQKQRDLAAANGEPFKFIDPCHAISKEEARERIAKGESYVVRQTIPSYGVTHFDDEVYGRIEVDNAILDESILLKSDGYPTYNFANIIDDHHMRITHVVRGNEYLSSTPKYNLIYQAYGWDIPKYVHVPPVMKDEQHKLSKRNGDASFQDLLKKGYLSEAILNYIALLGWSPEDEQEIFSLKELEEKFCISRINKSPAIFDIEKLKWMNGVYLREMSVEEFNEHAMPYYAEAVHRDVDYMELSRTIQPRVETLVDIIEAIDFLDQAYPFDASLYLNKKMKTTPENSLEALKWALEKMEEIEDYSNDEALQQMFLDLAVEHGVKNGRIMYPVRVALSNKARTPGGATEIAHLLGKEESLKRMREAIAELEKVVA
ncbi:MAG: glutamate--tRNA ligase [Erysipelotrichaceae bacterium]|nr:glutamate--tRNA ligase [Erysipelotrichaceae bacterium]